MYIFFDGTAAGTSWRGWSSGQSIYLKFQGEGWITETEALLGVIDAFVSHEIFHLWNSWAASPAEGVPPWLTEGFAEFYSLMTRNRSGRIDDAETVQALARSASGCMNALSRGQGLPPASTPIDQSPYECGLLIAWLAADLDSRKGHSPTDAWNRVFQEQQVGYQVSDWIAKADLEEELGWSDIDLDLLHLRVALENAGYLVEQDFSSTAYRSSVKTAIYTNVLRAACDGPPYGFYNNAGYVELDTGKRCGILNGNPKVVGVEGYNLESGDARAALVAAKNSCNRRRSLRLELLDGSSIEATCHREISGFQPTLTVGSKMVEARLERVRESVFKNTPEEK